MGQEPLNYDSDENSQAPVAAEDDEDWGEWDDEDWGEDPEAAEEYEREQAELARQRQVEEERRQLGIMPGSPVAAQFDQLENQTLDPVQLARNAAKFLGDKLNNVDTIQAYNDFTSRLGQRIIKGLTRAQESSLSVGLSSSSVEQVLGEQGARTGALQQGGYQGRLLSSDFENILGAQPGNTVTGMFFQLQNTDVIKSIFASRAHYNLAVQVADMTLPSVYERDAGRTMDIYGPNKLVFEMNQLLYDQRGQRSGGEYDIRPVKSLGSVHLKAATVEYSRTEAGVEMLAMIGSQNPTNALMANNTLDEMLTFRAMAEPGNSLAALQETSIARQIKLGLEAFHSSYQADELFKPLGFQEVLQERLQNRTLLGRETQDQANIFTGTAVGQQYGRVLQLAVRRGDTVVMTVNQMNLLLEKQGGDLYGIKTSLIALARSNQLTLVVDRKTYGHYKDQMRHGGTTGESGSYSVLDIIGRQGGRSAIVLADAGLQHSKGMLILDKGSEKIMFYGAGSANLSRASLAPLESLNEGNVSRAIEGFDPQTQAQLRSGTLNTELNVFMARGDYASGGTETMMGIAETGKLLNSRRFARVGEQYQAIAHQGRQQGFLAERRNVSLPALETLEKSLMILQLRGADVQVSGRYSGDGQNLVGLKVTVGGGELGLYRSTLNLTALADGRIIESSTGRVFSQSALTNQGKNPVRFQYDAYGGARTIGVGQTVELSAMETAVGVVATLERTMRRQQEVGLGVKRPLA